MATTKWANDAVMDGALNIVKTATALRVCAGSTSPATRSAAVTATLATVTLDTSDFTIANGDTSGRKVTVGQQADLSITTSGDATCVCLDDGTNLLYVTTATTQALTSGGTVTVPAWDIEISDPS